MRKIGSETKEIDSLARQPPAPTTQNSDNDVLTRTLTDCLGVPTWNLTVDQFPSTPYLKTGQIRLVHINKSQTYQSDEGVRATAAGF